MIMVGVKHNVKVVAPYADYFCFDKLGWRAHNTTGMGKSTVVMMFSKLKRKSFHSNLNNKSTNIY